MILELFAVLGVIVAGALFARQNGQLRKLENDLYALRMAFLAHREGIADGPQDAGASPATAARSGAPGVAASPDSAEIIETNTPPIAPDELLEKPVAAGESAAASTRAAAAAEPGPWSAEPAVPATIAHPPAERPRRDIETALGTRWAVWVGGLALAFGAVFLIRYSIEAGVFGPRLRLTLAAILGLALAGGGEFLRRNAGFKMPVEGLQNAYVPAILTAAGAFTLFGTVYAAHAIYGFIGPTAAFTLLGVVGIATVAAALIHGQWLGALGLIGSYATPALVASNAPNAWALFVFVGVILVAAAVIARARRWTPLMALAFAGPGLWLPLYLARAPDPDFIVVLFNQTVTLASLAFIWLGAGNDRGRIDAASIVPAVLSAVAATALGVRPELVAAGGFPYAAVVTAAMLAVAVHRERALALAAGAAFAAVVVHARAALGGSYTFEFSGGDLTIDGLPVLPFAPGGALWSGGLALLFVGAGLWSAWRFVGRPGWRAAAWAALAVVPPLAILVSDWVAVGNLDVDPLRAALAGLLFLAFAAGCEWVARAETPPQSGGRAVSVLVGGGFVALALALMMAFGPGVTTVLTAAVAAAAALATRRRDWPALGWAAVAAVLLTILRIAIDPTIVGSAALSTRPVLNQLLAGYGLPTLFFAFAAWQLARTTNGRPRLVMEAAAALFAMLTAAMLTRHAMNGGVIDADAPTLGEQAIYTLIAFGGSGILIALDQRAPSPVFRIGSIIVGVLSAAFVVLQHFLFLNPLFTEESTGSITFFNLLLLGYLMPAIAAALLALYARGKRPQWYVAGLALIAATLAFAYATLSVRRLFKGEFIGLWKGMEQLETYAYSALWLAMGVVILAIGVRLKSQVLRLASAVLVVLAVGKTFLIDMSELEGVLRALSFIGLGGVLIGIGLFYQRMLVKAARAEPAGR
ncbi:MAG: DUF2339 domain-containing protein [Rhizobiaceae bacterium]